MTGGEWNWMKGRAERWTVSDYANKNDGRNGHLIFENGMFSDRILSAAFCRASDNKWNFHSRTPLATTGNTVLLFWVWHRFVHFNIQISSFKNHSLYDSTMSKVLLRVLPALRLPVRGNNQRYDRQVLLIVALIVAHIHFVHLFIDLVKQDLNSTLLPLNCFSNSDFPPLLGDDQSTPPP